MQVHIFLNSIVAWTTKHLDYTIATVAWSRPWKKRCRKHSTNMFKVKVLLIKYYHPGSERCLDHEKYLHTGITLREIARLALTPAAVLTTVCNKSLLSHVSKMTIDFVPRREQAAQGHNKMHRWRYEWSFSKDNPCGQSVLNHNWWWITLRYFDHFPLHHIPPEVSLPLFSTVVGR